MTQGQPTPLAAASGRAPRRWWVLVVLAYWVAGAVASAVLPWMLPVLPHLLNDAPGPYGASQAEMIAGSILLGLLIHVPIAIVVGLVLGLASAAVARLTRSRASGLRRWAVYLAVLLGAYVLVVVTVHVLAPTATVSVHSYAGWTALLAVGSCFLLAHVESPSRADQSPQLHEVAADGLGTGAEQPPPRQSR